MDVGHQAELETTLEVVEGLRGSWRSEAELQRVIGEHLESSGLKYFREHRLSSRDRIDFAVGQSQAVGVEVKVEGSYVKVAAQLLRYCEHECFDALVLVTTVPSHLKLRGMRNSRGIPVFVLFVALNGL